MSQSKKKKFFVSEYKSLAACLDEMDKEGYQPVRRTEKPIFKETPDGPKPVDREIIFEGKLK